MRKAKELDLLTYLQRTAPGELVKSGPGEWRTKRHGSLVISNGKWHWFAGQVGGRSALDYLVKVEGMPFPEAVRQLSEVAPPDVGKPSVQERPQTEKSLRLPTRSVSNDRAKAYLTGRGIEEDLIQRCIDAGTLYESGSGHCVFVGRDKAGVPRYAALRGMDSQDKRDAPGSNKDYGFCLPAQSGQGRILAVFESPIDALSYVTLHKADREVLKDCTCLSLGGTSPKGLLAYLRENPQITVVRLCLDNDEAGQRGMAALREILQASPQFAHIILQTDAPPKALGKDYNEVLQHRRQAQTHHDHADPPQMPQSRLQEGFVIENNLQHRKESKDGSYKEIVGPTNNVFRDHVFDAVQAAYTAHLQRVSDAQISAVVTERDLRGAVLGAENPLKIAEMSMEQNYNMIDGVMNNMPPKDENVSSQKHPVFARHLAQRLNEGKPEPQQAAEKTAKKPPKKKGMER